MRLSPARDLLLSVLLAAGASSGAVQDAESDAFSGLVELVGRHGWKAEVSPPSSAGKASAALTRRNLLLRFEVPEDDGYYPRVDLLVMTFPSRAKVPQQDGHVDQVYPSFTFPVAEFAQYEKIVWVAYRHDRTVYIVHTRATRQSLEMFDWLVSYMRARARGEASALELLERKLAAEYAEKNGRFQGVKILQRLFGEQGAYHGPVDGMFGPSTRRALQVYLKSRGYYRGPTDGWRSEATRAALRRLQTALGIDATGDVTLATAQAIDDRERRRIL